MVQRGMVRAEIARQGHLLPQKHRADLSALWTRGTLLGLASLLAGCATLANPYIDMSAEQIAAAVKDKNLTAWCFVALTPYGKALTSILNLDKAVLPKGSTLTIKPETCETILTTGETR